MDSYRDKGQINLENRKVATMAFLLSGVALAVMLFGTTPTDIGPQGVTAFFMLLFIFSLSTLELIYRATVARRKHWHVWLRVTYALLPVAIIALSSLRQLNSFDIAVVIFLGIAVTIFHGRSSS